MKAKLYRKEKISGGRPRLLFLKSRKVYICVRREIVGEFVKMVVNFPRNQDNS
jgi:hypothetical protein